MSRIFNLIGAFNNVSTYNLGDCYRSTVASRRCVQNSHEEGIRQNPDDFVKHFLSEQEIECALGELEALRAWSFYHYLLARTHHFDQVFQEAVDQGVQQIVLFGSGWETRAYRFSGLLRERGISVLETDLPVAIREKEARVRSLGNYEYVRFRSRILRRRMQTDAAEPLLQFACPAAVHAVGNAADHGNRRNLIRAGQGAY